MTKSATNSVQHTPGPWDFTEGDAEKRAMSDIYKADDKEFRIGYVTCEWQNPQQRAEDIANARVMTAAPELLKALKAFFDPWNKGGDWQSELTYETFDNARKAIAKAEGR